MVKKNMLRFFELEERLIQNAKGDERDVWVKRRFGVCKGNIQV